MSEPLIYEVNLAVEPELEEEYVAWLREHVAEMCALPGFLDASIFSRRPEDEAVSPARAAAESSRLLFTVLYRLESRAALERYFAEHAPRMREEGLRRFGGRFTATRRVLEPLDA